MKKCYRVLYAGDDTAFAIWAESEEEALEKAMTRNESELEEETDKMDYLVTEFTPETNGTGMIVFYDAYQVRERKGVSYVNREKPKAAEKSIEKIAYEKFKLYWMLHHGISMKDVAKVVAEWLEAKDEDESFDTYLEETGFFGSTIWPCFHEFLNAEYQDEGLMESILSEQEYKKYKESEKKTYHKILVLSFTVSKKYQNILRMTGKEIYDKFGLKRDEVLSNTITFEDGCEMDIKLVICNEEERPYTEAVLFKDGREISHTFCKDSYLGKWVLEDNGNTYQVLILERKGITKDMILDGLHRGVVQLIMSPHDDGVACQIGENWFYFGGHEAEEAKSVEEYQSNIPEEDIVNSIVSILSEFAEIEEYRDEYEYYLAVLLENKVGYSDRICLNCDYDLSPEDTDCCPCCGIKFINKE